jgi:hypothetical protein
VVWKGSRSTATTRRKMSLPRRRAANHRLVFSFYVGSSTHWIWRKEEVKSALCMAFSILACMCVSLAFV